MGRFLGCAFELPLPVVPPWPTLFLGRLILLLLGHFTCLRPKAVHQPTLGPNLKLEPKLSFPSFKVFSPGVCNGGQLLTESLGEQLGVED